MRKLLYVMFLVLIMDPLFSNPIEGEGLHALRVLHTDFRFPDETITGKPAATAPDNLLLMGNILPPSKVWNKTNNLDKYNACMMNLHYYYPQQDGVGMGRLLANTHAAPKRYYIPNEAYRGAVARTYLYAFEQGCLDIREELLVLYRDWNATNPPELNEFIRYRLIHTLTNQDQRYIRAWYDKIGEIGPHGAS